MPGSNLDYVGANLTGEYSGGVQRRYVFDPDRSDAPLVWYEGAGTSDRRYLAADERGSIVAVSDQAGNALAINRYDEYGIPQAGNLGRFQYTGQKWIAELGMYDYKARMYSPTLGRFLQTDPIGYADGLNWYNYVGSDPINGTDPSGMLCTGSIIIKKCGPGDGVVTIWPNGPSQNNGTGDSGQPRGENTGHPILLPGGGLPTYTEANGDIVVTRFRDRYISSYFLALPPSSLQFAPPQK